MNAAGHVHKGASTPFADCVSIDFLPRRVWPTTVKFPSLKGEHMKRFVAALLTAFFTLGTGSAVADGCTGSKAKDKDGMSTMSGTRV